MNRGERNQGGKTKGKGDKRDCSSVCPVPGGFSMSYLLSKLSLAVSLLRVSL